MNEPESQATITDERTVPPIDPLPWDRLVAGTRRSAWASCPRRLFRIRRLRALALRMVLRCEGGWLLSRTARELFRDHHGVQIGAYSYGVDTGLYPAGVRIGRYVSLGPGIQVFLRDHPLERLSLHPFFYNAALGLVPVDNIPNDELEIGHDVWIGANAIITSRCRRIGTGAVVAAGAVVTKPVPDFAIVGGNPARTIRYRFSESLIERILASRWWEQSIDQLRVHLNDMVVPLTDEQHPLLKSCALAH